jgi:hypothetical protein
MRFSRFARWVGAAPVAVLAYCGFVDHIGGTVPVEDSEHEVLPPAPERYPLPGDAVFVDRFSVRHLGRVRRGDVVTHLDPDHPEKVVIDHVIGLPGDRVSDQPLGSLSGWFQRRLGLGVVVPEGHCAVAARPGTVPLGLVHGRVVGVLSPWERCGTMIAAIEPDPRLLLKRASPRKGGADCGRASQKGAAHDGVTDPSTEAD